MFCKPRPWHQQSAVLSAGSLCCVPYIAGFSRTGSRWSASILPTPPTIDRVNPDMPSPNEPHPETSRGRRVMALAIVSVFVTLILGSGEPVRAFALPSAGHHCPTVRLIQSSVTAVAQPAGTQPRTHSTTGSVFGDTCQHHDATPSISNPSILGATTTTSPTPIRATSIGDATSHSPEPPPPRA